MCTLLYLKWITKKDLLYSVCKSAHCYVASWMGGEFVGRLDKCIRMAESLCCSPEIIITLLIGYIPIQNKKFKKIKRSEEHRQMVQSLVPIPRYLKKKVRGYL